MNFLSLLMSPLLKDVLIHIYAYFMYMYYVNFVVTVFINFIKAVTIFNSKSVFVVDLNEGHKIKVMSII